MSLPKDKTKIEEYRKKISLVQKKRFKTMKHPLLGYKFTEEAKEKMSISRKKFLENGGKIWNRGMKFPERSGENHFAWRGGTTSLKKKLKVSADWKEWRSAVFNRDNYKCFDCGEGGYLEPHHILPLKESLKRIFDITNGITLCRPCHIKTMGKELELARTYFSFIQT